MDLTHAATISTCSGIAQLGWSLHLRLRMHRAVKVRVLHWNGCTVLRAAGCVGARLPWLFSMVLPGFVLVPV